MSQPWRITCQRPRNIPSSNGWKMGPQAQSRQGQRRWGQIRWCWLSLIQRASSTPTLPRGQTVNADYIIKALQLFWRCLRLKRLDHFKNGFIFHWDNAPVHMAGKGKMFLQKNKVEMLDHPPTAWTWPQPTISCFESKGRPRWWLPGHGDLQNQVGQGHWQAEGGRQHQGLPEVGGPPPKVHLFSWRLCWEEYFLIKYFWITCFLCNSCFCTNSPRNTYSVTNIIVEKEIMLHLNETMHSFKVFTNLHKPFNYVMTCLL